MRLLFLNRSFWPDPEATGQLLTELCADLSREHEVAVIAGPSYHVPRRGRGLLQRDSCGAVRVIRTWGTRLPKRRLRGRLLNLGTYYSLAVWAALREGRPDVVIAETDPPLLGVLGALLKARWGCRFVYYCQDIYPDVAERSGGVGSRRLLDLLAAANRRAYAAADEVIVLGRDMRQRLLDKGVAAEKVAVLSNWVDCDAVRPLDANPFRRQFGDKFVVMYSGNLGMTQSLECVVDAAERLRDDERVVFVLIGDGAKKAELEERVRLKRLSNVLFFAYQEKELLAQSLGAADLHLVPLRAGLEGCLVPSKVYGVLAAGRPYVAMMDQGAEVAALARELRVGFVVPPDDPEALVHTVAAAVQQPAMLAEMGARGRRLAESRFDRAVQTRQFADLLGNVCKRSRRRGSRIPLRTS